MDIPQFPNEILYHIAGFADNETLCVLSTTTSVTRRRYKKTVAYMTANATTMACKTYSNGILHGPTIDDHSIDNYCLGMRHGPSKFSHGGGDVSSFWFHDKEHGPLYISNGSKCDGTIQNAQITSWRHGIRHGPEIIVNDGIITHCEIWDMGSPTQSIHKIIRAAGKYSWQIYEAYYRIVNDVEWSLSEPVVKYAYDVPRLPLEALYNILNHADNVLMLKLSVTSPIFRNRIQYLANVYKSMAKKTVVTRPGSARCVFGLPANILTVTVGKKQVGHIYHGTRDIIANTLEGAYIHVREKIWLDMFLGCQYLYMQTSDFEQTKKSFDYYYGMRHGLLKTKKLRYDSAYKLKLESWRFDRKHGVCIKWLGDSHSILRIGINDHGSNITEDIRNIIFEHVSTPHIKRMSDIKKIHAMLTALIQRFLSAPVVK